jgi:hypothetical protein
MEAHDTITTTPAPGYPIPAREARPIRITVGVDVQKVLRAAAAAGLVALMSIGSVALWTAVPLGVLWAASQLTHSLEPSAGPYIFVAVGIPVAMALVGKGLASLDRIYTRVTGATPRAREIPAWRRSISDAPSSHKWGVLDKIMVASVLIAAIAMTTWFFVFAGPTLPA